MQSIEGATAFVTGGASGIGLGIARALAERGAKVAIADVRDDHLAEAVAEAPGLLPLRLDVTDRAAMAEAIAKAEEALGPLRILVNNAGVGIEGPVDQAGFDDWDWGVSVNLMGVANGLVVGLPRIKAHGLGGHVVNTASLGALMKARHTRGIYATTKAGIVALSEHLLLELEGSGIHVSVLCPGPVKTNIRESGRTRPEHLKERSKFLEYENALAERPDGPMWLDPLAVGHMVVEAILGERLYVITHPEFIASVKARHAAIEAAMGA